MRAAGTSMRDGALHDCPELVHMLATSRATTAARSASSRTMLADLPPSSCATRFTVGAARRATSMPARVEPVNDTMSTSGWAARAAPTVAPSPCTRLNTPAGTPASSRISVNTMALSGDTSDGFSTIVQPAASAGATLHATWFIGQFHGVIRAHTPTGSRTSNVEPTCTLELEVGEGGAHGGEVGVAGPGLGALGQRRRGAHLAADQVADLGPAHLVALDDAVEQVEALLAARLRIALEGVTCRGDGGVDVVGVADGDRGDRLLGGRVDHVQRVAAHGIDPLAADVELLGVLHRPSSGAVAAHVTQRPPGPPPSDAGGLRHTILVP